MNTLSIRRFGFALGSTCAVTYVACAIVMASVSRETTIRFFNGILHGLDISSILIAEMSIGGVVVGVVEVFVLGWLFGAILACVYNVSAFLGPKGT